VAEDIEYLGPGEVSLEIDAAAPLSLGLEKSREAIQKHWQVAVAASPQLYDGKLFCASRVDEVEGAWRLKGEFLPYSAFHAQRHGGLELGLFAVAVSGVVFGPAEKTVLCGKRSGNSASWKGAWELVPSGSVDGTGNSDLDWKGQLVRELKEESGIDSQASSWQALGLVRAPDVKLYEIFGRLVLESQELPGPFPEHENMAFETLDKAAQLLETGPAVPTNASLLKLAGNE